MFGRQSESPNPQHHDLAVDGMYRRSVSTIMSTVDFEPSCCVSKCGITAEEGFLHSVGSSEIIRRMDVLETRNWR